MLSANQVLSYPSAKVRDLGVHEYAPTLALQKSLVDQKKIDPLFDDCLILVEHPEVYTFGRKTPAIPPGLSNALLVERGGESTYHNPGQLVVYTILSLIDKERDIHWYLRALETALIATLKPYSIEGERRLHETGVWLKGRNKKIASIGVAISGWVTYHGLALNVMNDLSGFSKIHPCGYSAEVMTSIKEEVGEMCPSLGEIKWRLVKELGRTLRRDFLV